MTPQEYRKIQRWKKERDEAIRETCKNDDLSIFKAFYEKYKAKGVYELPLPTDDILELSIRKMLYHMASATVEERRYAKRWLEEHGSTTSIGGRGMMMRGDEDDDNSGNK